MQYKSDGKVLGHWLYQDQRNNLADMFLESEFNEEMFRIDRMFNGITPIKPNS